MERLFFCSRGWIAPSCVAGPVTSHGGTFDKRTRTIVAQLRQRKSTIPSFLMPYICIYTTVVRRPRRAKTSRHAKAESTWSDHAIPARKPYDWPRYHPPHVASAFQARCPFLSRSHSRRAACASRHAVSKRTASSIHVGGCAALRMALLRG